MSAKHTAAPWRTQGWVPTWAYIPVKDARHNIVCSMHPDDGHGYTREEVEANAHLIAAAPTMLDALARVEWWLSTVPQGAAMRDVCRAAIKEARGE